MLLGSERKNFISWGLGLLCFLTVMDGCFRVGNCDKYRRLMIVTDGHLYKIKGWVFVFCLIEEFVILFTAIFWSVNCLLSKVI